MQAVVAAALYTRLPLLAVLVAAVPVGAMLIMVDRGLLIPAVAVAARVITVTLTPGLAVQVS